MYKNRIRPTSTNLDVQSFIRRCEIAYDKRARYVEFVCSVWNEGRFGPDLAEPVTVNWNDRPESEPASFLDLDDAWPNGLNCFPSAVSPSSALKRFLGRAGRQAAETARQKANQMRSLAAAANVRNSTSSLSPNQGRGSPELSGTHVFFPVANGDKPIKPRVQ